MHLETAVAQYHDLRGQVLAKVGKDGRANLQSLLLSTVFDRNLSMEDVFMRIWDKPLFSGVRVENGEKWKGQLREAISLISINDFDEKYLVSKAGHAKPIGNKAKSLCGKTSAANWRVCNIIRMARGLQNRNDLTLGDVFGHEDIDLSATLNLINTLSDAFGVGWGTITCFHAAADLGYPVIKPDIHVGKSMFRLGWFYGIGNNGYPYVDSDIKNMFRSSLIIQMAAQARARLVGDVLLENNDRAFRDIANYSILREIDLVLMRASQLNMVDVHHDYYELHAQ